MRFLLTVLAALAFSAGCGANDASRDESPPGGDQGAGMDASADFGATSITFSESAIVFVPGKTRLLELRVAPAGSYTVHLALVGDALDAYLDRSQVETARDGFAAFSFTAPSLPATFSIRASVGQVKSEVGASAGTGNTTLQIVPLYGGHRKITSWVGTVNAGGKCDPASGVPPADGVLTAEAPDKPRVRGVPLGTSLTVTVRAGHFAGGCVELSNIVADDAGTALSVTVPAADRPLSMGAARIPVRLGIDTSGAWITAYTDLADQMGARFSPDGGTDASALLDAMSASTPAASRSAFTLSRTTRGWDSRLLVSLHDVLGLHALRTTAGRWITDALPVLATDALRGTLHSSAMPTGSAWLTVTSVGGLPPADCGFPGMIQGLSWTTAPEDHVLFGGKTASFGPSVLAAALALGPAKKEVPTALTVPDALGTVVGCSDVANLLVGSDKDGLACDACDAACAEQLCKLGLVSMWNRARDTATNGGLLELSASAAVIAVSDDAAPTDLHGTWVGDVELGADPIHVGGSAEGGALATAKP